MAKKAPTLATRQEIQQQALALTQRGSQRWLQRCSQFAPRLTKVAQALVLSTALGVLPAQSMAADAWGNNNILIPEMGTAGALGITVQREMAIGDFFLRTARSMLPVVDDPVLNEYVSTLGQRLLSHADNVQFPFDFFVVKNDTLNASAFLGGKVVIHTGLFTYAETEDEFASVLAHEISHVTQRHIARFIEGMTRASQLSTAGVVGAIVMTILNPAVGMAAISTTMGASMQSRINFTRDNEYEADRIGINLLYRAGLNPQGTVDMFRRLAAQQGNVNPAFALLLDHPLSEARMAEAQNRVALLGHRKNSTNPDYEFAKARVEVRYGRHTTPAQYEDLKRSLELNVFKRSSIYQNYALALTCLELDQIEEARAYVKRLPKSLQRNMFVLDLLTDIDLKAKNPQRAIERLYPYYQRNPHNQVIVANLASAYNEAQQYRNSKQLLVQYLRYKPKDVLALNLLSESYVHLRDRCNAMQTRGEIFALSAAYAQAMGMYNQALTECTDMLTRERIKARVSEIAVQRSFDENLNR